MFLMHWWLMPSHKTAQQQGTSKQNNAALGYPAVIS